MLPRLESYINTHKEEAERVPQLVEFAGYITGIVDALNIQPESISGRILLVGCGSSSSPEVALISPDMLGYPVPLYPQISKVTAVDQGDMVLSTWDYDPQEKMSFHEYTSLHDFISRKWDGERYDNIFLLRVNNLNDQLQAGLDKDIATLLDPNGVFICSGTDHASPYFLHSEHLNLLRTANVDAYSYPYFMSVTHTAYLATKK